MTMPLLDDTVVDEFFDWLKQYPSKAQAPLPKEPPQKLLDAAWQAVQAQQTFIIDQGLLALVTADKNHKAESLGGEHRFIPMSEENYLDWLKRKQKTAKVISFPKMNFRYLTEVQRLAADSRDVEDALPEIPLMSANQEFRLTVESLAQNKLKLTLEALGLASSRYANCLIGISATDSKEQLICIMRLNADGDGIDDTLDNTAATRQALLRPVIGLIDE
jgi:hypothetical protein